MPVLDHFVDLQILKGLRAFLRLETGVVRGAVPKPGGEQERKKKDRELAELGRKLARANEELAGLKAAQHNGGSARENAEVPIFFVVGSPKSGTTWLRKMLDENPDILCRGEGRFFGRNDRNESVLKYQTNMTGHRLRAASLYNALLEDEYLRVWLERTVWSRDGDPEEHINHLTGYAVRYFLKRKLAQSGKKIVGDKTPLQGTEVISEIHRILPEAKVIHIIRDGRDQAISHAHHRWNRVRPVEEGGRLLPEDRSKRDRYREDPEKFLASGESIFSEEYLTSAAKGWRSNVGRTRQDGVSLLGSGYAEVRYEDLLQRPGEEMSRLFRFLGARDKEWIVRRSVERNTFERKTRRQPGQEESTLFLRKGVAGDWRRVFNERDRRIYKEFAGDLLVELGYEKDRDW